ncbi:MAG: N-acetylmuramoyl-L-alanine amidase, partial [Ruminococcus sp.]
NLGVKERPGLVVLRRTRMPAVLVEAGFINSDADNELFDEKFQDIAQAIAGGIMGTLDQESAAETPAYYRVQVGAYRQLGNAVTMEQKLRRDGYSTIITT